MKNLAVYSCFRNVVCICLFAAFAVCLCGCGGAGETAGEVKDRHGAIMRTQMHMIQDDVDAVILLDRPTRLTDKLTR